MVGDNHDAGSRMSEHSPNQTVPFPLPIIVAGMRTLLLFAVAVAAAFVLWTASALPTRPVLS
jgi:hypothetical protein